MAKNGKETAGNVQYLKQKMSGNASAGISRAINAQLKNSPTFSEAEETPKQPSHREHINPLAQQHTPTSRQDALGIPILWFIFMALMALVVLMLSIVMLMLPKLNDPDSHQLNSLISGGQKGTYYDISPTKNDPLLTIITSE